MANRGGEEGDSHQRSPASPPEQAPTWVLSRRRARQEASATSPPASAPPWPPWDALLPQADPNTCVTEAVTTPPPKRKRGKARQGGRQAGEGQQGEVNALEGAESAVAEVVQRRCGCAEEARRLMKEGRARRELEEAACAIERAAIAVERSIGNEHTDTLDAQ